VVFLLLKFAILDFIEDREFKNLSVSTINQYRNVLGEFQNYCAEEKEVLNVEDVTFNTVRSYLLKLKKINNNPVTINTKIKNLKAFFNYMTKSSYIDEKRNPMNQVEKLKEDTKIEVFNDFHIQQMLSYYQNMKGREHSLYAYRNYTLILLLLGTGIRLGELCNIKWSDVDLIHAKIIIFGKNRIQQSVPITERLIKELSEYKMFCQHYFESELEFVFVNLKNERLTPNAVKNVFKRLKDVMNFKDVRLSAHTFRHTFAHRFLINGGDVFTLQKMLRHSNLKMTEKYLALWGTALKEQNDKFNPLNNLKF
jgi:integrase/recombinase XerD